MTWIYYILEANLYLAVFYTFYKVVLQDETFYALNRYYLCLTPILSFSLPAMQVGYLFDLFGFHRNQELSSIDPNAMSGKIENYYTSAQFLLPTIHSSVAFVLLIVLIIRITGILRLASKSRIRDDAQISYLELEGEQMAFSFFGLLFINPSIADKETVIRHELVHIRQRHSVDVLFFELVQILGWFNPVTYLYQKDIKLLHEYIADELTTQAVVAKHDYAMLLIQNSFGAQSNTLTNQIFNQSVLKKRISMLNKEKSGTVARLKLLLALPVVAGLICVSTMAFTKDYSMLDLYPGQTVAQEPTETLPPPPPAEPRVTNIKKTSRKLPPAPPAEPRVKNIRKAKPAKRSLVEFPPPILKSNIAIPPPTPVEPSSAKQHLAPPPPPVEPTRSNQG